ncbi:XRE family transcriptional regulator [bacterium D16-76]|nr:XRE family transcriptional regulator [bacterium D16-76]
MDVQRENIMKALGERIRSIRHKLSISQEELAFRAKLNSAYLGQVERGLRCPTIDTLCRIALALEITPADLLRSEDLPDGAVGYDQRMKELMAKVPPEKMGQFFKVLEDIIGLL